MIDDGALDDVDVIFGWHNWPALGRGRMACPCPATAANGTFTIEIACIGGHASQPEATRDPVLAAAAITVALQQIVSRRLAPQTAAVVAGDLDRRPQQLHRHTGDRRGRRQHPGRPEHRRARRGVRAHRRDRRRHRARSQGHGRDGDDQPLRRHGQSSGARRRAAHSPVLELTAAFGADDHTSDVPIPVMASRTSATTSTKCLVRSRWSVQGRRTRATARTTTSTMP